jgi:hypothetical protein
VQVAPDLLRDRDRHGSAVCDRVGRTVVGKVAPTMFRLLGPSLFLAFVVAAQPAQAILIDGFDSGDAFVLENVGSGAQLTQSAAVLGGTRTVSTSNRVEFNPSVGSTSCRPPSPPPRT